MACITNCPKCGKCYEESSEECADSPSRECMDCWMKARTEENLRVYEGSPCATSMPE